jgi:hypothetical protein
VEDNPINAMVAEKLLNKWNIKTSKAVNGLLALKMVNIEKFDAILMDIHMPEMDGFEASNWIRNEPNPNQFTPIIALTADITAESNSSFYFDKFLRKPIESEKLFTALLNIK